MSDQGNLRWASLLMGATALSSVAPAVALAQTAGQTASQTAAPAVEEVVVTGYRASLISAAESKRAAVNFTESVVAKDLGKFPDLNLAEALQRVPGVQINRDNMTGEGTQVRVRGLGASFTKVTLNNNTINPASDGGIDDVASNREVDLNLFPVELFTKLEVNKSPLASQAEGGLSVVNLRAAHAFDNEGQHLAMSVNSGMSSVARKAGIGGSLLASSTWDKVGVLAGFAGNVSHYRDTSWWSSGWTNANLTCAGCDNSQSNLFTFATSVPTNANVGLPTGTPLTIDRLLALNPGLTGDQLTNAYLPRSDRHELLQGTRKRITGVFSIEARPTEDLRFSVDVVGNRTWNEFDRYNSNWYVRSSAPNSTGGLVPLNVKVDANNIVTSGTFANTNFFTTQRHAEETADFYNVNPAVSWQVNDRLKLNLQGNFGQSVFHRNMPTLWVSSINFTGARTEYKYDGGDTATVTPVNFNYADPNSGLWEWGSLSTQIDKRVTKVKGAKFDVNYELTQDQHVSAGLAYDDTRRKITGRAMDASAAVKALVPQSQIGQYLSIVTPDNLPNQGYRSYVIVQDRKLKDAVNWENFERSSPDAIVALNSVSAGDIQEKIKAAYVEYNGRFDIADRDLRVNAGVRRVETDQTVTGPVRAGSTIILQTRKTSYDTTLPTVNLAYNLRENLIVRAAASKSMTRANPQQLLPGTVFTDPSAQSASAGNPNLSPYFSKNLDFGVEYYTGGAGYVAVGLFRKKITGFPTTQTTNVTFKDLGIPIETLAQFARDSLISRGGDNAPIFLNKPVNTDNVTLKGAELSWVQPLDFLVKGTGFNSSLTLVDDGDTPVPTNVAKRLFNFTAYYESGPLSVHASYVKQSKKLQAGSPQNGFIAARLFDDARYQVDLSASYTLRVMGHESQISFDATNLTKQKIRRTFVDRGARLPLLLWNPGSTYRLELSTRF